MSISCSVPPVASPAESVLRAPLTRAATANAKDVASSSLWARAWDRAQDRNGSALGWVPAGKVGQTWVVREHLDNGNIEL